MSLRRKSTISHSLNHARASVVSLYSALDAHDVEPHRLSRCLSAISMSKADVYHVLERQEGTRTLAYHLFVFALTLISLIFGSISTINEWRPTLDSPLYHGEAVLCVFFALELLLRIWSAGCLAQYRTWRGRLRFLSRPAIIVDTLTLFGFVVALSTGVRLREFPTITLRFLPLLQMIRFLRVDRQLTSWTILKGIIITHRQELTVTLVISFMFLITGSYLVHIAETPADPRFYEGPFRSAADTMWFSIISMTTIGFGDLYPTTYVAKMFTTTICFLGVAFWCLPAGIIGSGLAIKVQEQKRDEALSRLVPAAASVIRNWWRLQCVHRGDQFVSTWKIYTLIQRRAGALLPHKEKSDWTRPNLARFSSPNPIASETKTNYIRRKSITGVNDIPQRYLMAIKIIRMLKYAVACKKFQEAKRPIDIKDVVKENTQMNNRLTMMLNDVQRRLDLALGTAKPASYLSDEQKRQISLSARIEKVEQIVNHFETKLNYLERLAVNLVKNA